MFQSGRLEQGHGLGEDWSGKAGELRCWRGRVGVGPGLCGSENGDGALQSLADAQLRLHGGRARAALGRVQGLGGDTGGLVVVSGRKRTREGKGDFAAWEGTGGAPGRRPVHEVCDTQAQELYRRQAPSGPQPARWEPQCPWGHGLHLEVTLVEGCWSTSAW